MQLAAAIKTLRLHVPGDKEPLWRMPLLELKDGSADLAKQSVVLGEVSVRDGVGSIHRESQRADQLRAPAEDRAVYRGTRGEADGGRVAGAAQAAAFRAVRGRRSRTSCRRRR